MKGMRYVHFYVFLCSWAVLSAPRARAAESTPATLHWAFRAPARPPPPAVADAAWGRNAIDRFVLAALEKDGWKPSPAADRVTLLRRLSLDLTGLPPTIDAIDAFLEDRSELAYERQVDRLLGSPHYGERWGRHWLDAARYADSDGYEKDKARSVWFYRDWVIDAINRDLPYDRFIVEQLAGDQLPNATQDQIVATGFLRNSMINEEGGVDPEQFRMEAMFDRIDAVGKSILGLTIQCAQCHDHKYDPLTQEEYYGLFAFLNNDDEAMVSVYTPREHQQRAELFGEIRRLEEGLKERHPDWRERMARWENEVRGSEPAWVVVSPEVVPETRGGQKFLPQPDQSLLAQGYAPTKNRFTLKVATLLEGITAFRLELLNDGNLPRGGPGRSIFGTGALTEFEVEAAPAGQPDATRKIEIVAATSDVELPEKPLHPNFDDRSGRTRVTGPAAFAIDGKEETAWGIDVGPGRRNRPRKAVFLAAEPISFPGGAVVSIHLSQQHGGWNSDNYQTNNMGRFRIALTTAKEVRADPLPRRVRRIIERKPAAQRSSAEQQAVFSYWRTTVPEWREESARIEAAWKRHPEGSTQLVLLPSEQARATRLLERGSFLTPGARVEAATPRFLHGLPAGAPPSRLTLGKWLVDRRSPTTARALANRVWQSYFGIGLVSSSEDLGTQSQPPSHPQLLDWLAVELMEGGWRVKDLHRLIVQSATYRQASRAAPQAYAADPRNRRLARGPRFRVEGEIVRDIALAASGLLSAKVGGPSVYPPLDDFLLKPPVSFGPKVWEPRSVEEKYRRGLYTFSYRTLPYPLLQAFDVPNGDASCVRRVRSNTPLQALVTLNEPVFVECARALAERTMKYSDAAGAHADADAARLTYAFRRCLGRRPTTQESGELLRLLRLQRKKGTEESAAWAVVCRVLLNLDETITKE